MSCAASGSAPAALHRVASAPSEARPLDTPESFLIHMLDQTPPHVVRLQRVMLLAVRVVPAVRSQVTRKVPRTPLQRPAERNAQPAFAAWLSREPEAPPQFPRN
jgi:hypothetical protein